MGTDAGERMGSLLPIPGGKRTVYSNVVSPWVSLSVGRSRGRVAACCDGHVDVIVGHFQPTNFGNLWTTVAPPPGERYVAVSSGAGHDEIGESGTSVSYLLRDNGSIDRRSDEAVGHARPRARRRRSRRFSRTVTTVWTASRRRS